MFNKTGRGEIGDYEEFLQERVLVTGGVALSTSPCDASLIVAHFSIQKLQEGLFNSSCFNFNFFFSTNRPHYFGEGTFFW